jgi:hypothetical protein
MHTETKNYRDVRKEVFEICRWEFNTPTYKVLEYVKNYFYHTAGPGFATRLLYLLSV